MLEGNIFIFDWITSGLFPVYLHYTRFVLSETLNLFGEMNVCHTKVHISGGLLGAAACLGAYLSPFSVDTRWPSSAQNLTNIGDFGRRCTIKCILIR